MRIWILLFIIPTISIAQEAKWNSVHLNIDASNILKEAKISGVASYSGQNLLSKPSELLLAESLNIDSILWGQKKVSFSRSGYTVALEKTDHVDSFSVYYSGTPQTDSSGWGGLIIKEGFAFNLGVGFQANPHSYGRSWFPALDVFDQKLGTKINITVPNNVTAIAVGHLINKVQNPTTSTYTFQLDEPVPAYLLSWAIGPYRIDTLQYNSVPPLRLAVPKDDQNKLEETFQHYPTVFSVFERMFGPHQFPFVGYVAVPFNGGAMEHPTNIAFPIDRLAFSESSEQLYTHELAHHWWGDVVTAETEFDMWINEGFATYAEIKARAAIYGKDVEENAWAELKQLVITSAEKRDGGAYGIANLPHSATYGTHTYKKGAEWLKALEIAMGEYQFFTFCREIQAKYQFSTLSSLQFLSELKTFCTKEEILIPFQLLSEQVFYSRRKQFGVEEIMGLEVNNAFILSQSILSNLIGRKILIRNRIEHPIFNQHIKLKTDPGNELFIGLFQSKNGMKSVVAIAKHAGGKIKVAEQFNQLGNPYSGAYSTYEIKKGAQIFLIE